MPDVTTMHQYEPLKPPASFGEDGKKLIMQMHEIFDDLYRRFNRLRLEDLSKDLRTRFTDAEDNVAEITKSATELAASLSNLEGDVSSVSLTTKGLAAAVNNNRIEFNEYGLIIKNANGDVVFSQETDTGDLTISGILRALGGKIGGFTINEGSLSNGTSIVLDAAAGKVRLGKLTITDSTNEGPVLESASALAIIIGTAMYAAFGGGNVQFNFPVTARYGLFLSPSNTTTLAPNMYMDPVTGEVFRSKAPGTGGETGGETGGTTLSVSASLSRTEMKVNETVAIYGTATGGTAPYVYTFEVSRDGGAYTTISGAGATRNYTAQQEGSYRFRVTAQDNASNSGVAYTNYVTVGDSQTSMTASVSADKSSLSGPGTVTWTAYASGGSGDYVYSITIYRDGNFYASGADQSLTVQLSLSGQYYAQIQVVDGETMETKAATGGYVQVGSATQYARTAGTNVNVRSGPATSYSVVTTIEASGTQVQITGSASNGWYPVYWNGYSGYIRSDLLTML